MTYEKYVNKLSILLKAQYASIIIFYREIAPYNEDFFATLSKPDLDRTRMLADSYYTFLKIYAKVYKNKLANVNRNNLSIKQTLQIMHELTILLYESILNLRDITQEINSKLKTTEVFKKLTKGIKHHLNFFKELEQYINELNITDGEDGSIQFDLNLIDDKSLHSIDFDQVLIPSEWKNFLPN